MSSNDGHRRKYQRQADQFRINFAKEDHCKSDPEFKAYCDEHIAWLEGRQVELNAMFEHADEVGFGAMFENESGDGWAIIFPDASQPGKVRYQQCKANGWISHSTFDTFDEVVLETHSAGFIKAVSSDLLATLSETPQWQEGNEIGSVIDKMNRKLITPRESHIMIKQIKERYAGAIDQSSDQEPPRQATMRMG